MATAEPLVEIRISMPSLSWDSVDLKPFLSEVLGDSSLQVCEPRRLVGGTRKDIWRFKVGAQNGAAAPCYVLRRIGPETDTVRLGLSDEYHLVRSLHQNGLPVTSPLWLSRDLDGNDCYVENYIEGEALPARVLKDERLSSARPTIVRQIASTLACIHSFAAVTDLTKVLGDPELATPAATQLRFQRALYENYSALFGSSVPVEMTMQFLLKHLPSDESVGLVHGDFRIGNIIFGPEGLRAVVDWERAHWGDYHEDLGWAMIRALRFGRDQYEMGGFCTERDFLNAYCEASGRSIDPPRLYWWKLFANLRWAVSCMGHSLQFCHNRDGSLELAAMGRMLSEVECEMINLLESPV